MTEREQVKKTRSSKLRKKARSVTELYGAGVGGGLLQGRYGTPQVYAWFQKRHRRGLSALDDDGTYRSSEPTQFGDDHTWKVPATVLLCLKQPLTPGQINVLEAWYVTWHSPQKQRLVRKRFSSPIKAIHFIATKAQYVDPHAALVSRQRTYDVPAKYRGKFPFKQQVKGKTRPRTWYWCPLCMQPRRFFAHRPIIHIYAMVKFWNDEKGRYDYADRKLALLECKYCGCTNRDSVFRRSNQPWEVRKFKPRVTRAKRRRK